MCGLVDKFRRPKNNASRAVAQPEADEKDAEAPATIEAAASGDDDREEESGRQRVVDGDEAKESVEVEADELLAEHVGSVDEERRQPTPPPDDGRVLAIVVHSTDRLKAKPYISHPLIKVHVVDAETGANVNKSVRSRAVSYNLEAHVDYILAQMTKPCDIRRLDAAVWHEMILFNESFDHLTNPPANVLLLFEMLEFPSATNQKSPTNSGNMRRLCWAFLRLVSGRGQANTGKLRLQLYRAPKQADVSVYQLWKQARRAAFPASLHVTVKAMRAPSDLPSAQRSIVALQEERPHETGASLDVQPETSVERLPRPRHARFSVAQTAAASERVPWGRVAGQPCRVPNRLLQTLSPARFGCYTLKFSPDGRTLACAAKDSEDKFPICFYEVPSLRARGAAVGHLALIHDLCWSACGESILSASADATARLWTVENGHCTQVYPHRSFVYAVLFHPAQPQIVYTAGYDGRIRVWQTTRGIEAQLLIEIDAHSGRVNVMVWEMDRSRLLSADCKGTIKVWSADTEGKVFDLTLSRTIACDELRNKSISSLHIHNDKRSLVVQSRDRCVRCVDLRSGAVKWRCNERTDGDMQLRSALSPCGRLLCCGAEDGRVSVWSALSGARLGALVDASAAAATHALYHPFEHLVAVGHFGVGGGVSVHGFDPKQAEIGADEDAVKDGKQADAGYADFSLQSLLTERRLLTRVDSTEAAATERRLNQTEPPEETAPPVVKQVTFASEQLEAKKRAGEVAFNRSESILEEAESVEDLVEALHDYEAQMDDELSVKKGDVIKVLSRPDNEWFVGELAQKTGYVPAAYVRQQSAES